MAPSDDSAMRVFVVPGPEATAPPCAWVRTDDALYMLASAADEYAHLFQLPGASRGQPLDEAALLGATSGPEPAPVEKVVEVIEFEIPVGFVASIDDVPS